MANTPRPPMTTPKEVLQWAADTKAANGEAFTMLKKEEQLLIANFIIAMQEHIKKLQDRSAQEEPSATSPDTPPETPPVTPQPAPEEPEEIKERDTGISLKQTNLEYFKANSVPMQRAYEIFQIWQDCDPANRMILDKKRGAYVASAAFAFWLGLPHE